MIRDRIFDINDWSSHDEYRDDAGVLLTEEQALLARETTGYTCPRCGSPTFGKFEPFVQRGINAWCSSCGYMHTDRQRFKAWLRMHPETVGLGSNAQNEI